MKKHSLVIVAGSLFLLASSCKSADKNADKIAADFCNCFSDLEKNLSSDTKKIFTSAANAADPTTTMQKDLMALDPEKQQKVSEELQSLGDIEDANSSIGRCMKDVEKKYDNAYSMNEDKTVRKIVAELEKKSGCEFTASLMKVGLKVKK